MKTVLTVKELAYEWGVSSDVIYALVRENALPSIRVRRRILFRREAVEQWMVQQEKKNSNNSFIAV